MDSKDVLGSSPDLSDSAYRRLLNARNGQTVNIHESQINTDMPSINQPGLGFKGNDRDFSLTYEGSKTKKVASKRFFSSKQVAAKNSSTIENKPSSSVQKNQLILERIGRSLGLSKRVYSDNELLRCESLDLSYLDLHQISKILIKCPNLTSLDLSNNKLQELPENFFTHFPNLRVLNLSSNKLEEVPDLRFLVNLIELDLSYNPFMRDQTFIDAYGPMKIMANLGQKGHILQSLPKSLPDKMELAKEKDPYGKTLDNIAGLKKLRKLTLKGLFLIRIPKAILLLPIIELDLSCNNFQEGIPIEIRGFTNLISLNLNGCWISSIPMGISTLRHLAILKLGSNTITKVPSSLHLPKLKHLEIGNNPNIEMLLNLFQRSPIETLVLTGSGLMKTPAIQRYGRTLKNLVMFKNNLNSSIKGNVAGVPKHVPEQEKLKKINFSHLPNLININLNNNCIYVLPILGDKVRGLKIQDNYLTEISAKDVPGFLATLDLRGNEIPSKDLQGLLKQFPKMQIIHEKIIENRVIDDSYELIQIPKAESQISSPSSLSSVSSNISFSESVGDFTSGEADASSSVDLSEPSSIANQQDEPIENQPSEDGKVSLEKSIKVKKKSSKGIKLRVEKEKQSWMEQKMPCLQIIWPSQKNSPIMTLFKLVLLGTIILPIGLALIDFVRYMFFAPSPKRIQP